MSGPGWTAIWTANRPEDGAARLYGYFQAEMSFYAPEPVSGTVTAVRGHWADLRLDATTSRHRALVDERDHEVVDDGSEVTGLLAEPG